MPARKPKGGELKGAYPHKSERCHEPNYECVLNEIMLELHDIAHAGRAGANELHLIRKSLQHIEKIFDHGGQIGKAVFTGDPPQPKTHRKA